jgi:hypothetical protein
MGRMPARTPDEVSAMVATTLRAATDSAPRTVTLVSDTADGCVTLETGGASLFAELARLAATCPG